VSSLALDYKLAPPALPSDRPLEVRSLAGESRVEARALARSDRADARLALRLEAPGRPPELTLTWDKYKAPKSAAALADARKRAHLLHTFWHHELQAAELMCWAVLAFPDTPLSFRRGLLNICLDEVRHMNLYAAHIEKLGFALGAFPVRDWFWQRAPSARQPAEFVALMSLGFEAGNLDHSERYVALFEAAGDREAAALQAQVGDEERAHVAFGAHWFRELTGGLDFESWRRALPSPLSPMVMRGRPVARAARLSAGLDNAFVDELEAWQPRSPGC
jgi:uncharacterized ferritin-like protein (DUF455 family)